MTAQRIISLQPEYSPKPGHGQLPKFRRTARCVAVRLFFWRTPWLKTNPRPGVWRQLFLPDTSISFAGSPPLAGYAVELHRCGSWAGQIQYDQVMGHPVMAAAVAMGLAKMRSHWEKTRLEVLPRSGVRSVRQSG